MLDWAFSRLLARSYTAYMEFGTIILVLAWLYDCMKQYDNGAVSHDRLYRSFRVGDAVRLGVTSSSFNLACSISEISTQYRHSLAPCECRVILAYLRSLCDRTKTTTAQPTASFLICASILKKALHSTVRAASARSASLLHAVRF